MNPQLQMEKLIARFKDDTLSHSYLVAGLEVIIDGFNGGLINQQDHVEMRIWWENQSPDVRQIIWANGTRREDQ